MPTDDEETRQADERRRRLVASMRFSEQFIKETRDARHHIPALQTAYPELRETIVEAAEARRGFGERLREFADSLMHRLADDSEETIARMAVARYYYSINHVLRAAHLARKLFDASPEGSGGHTGVFEAIGALASEAPDFLAKLRQVTELGAAIEAAETKAWRPHVATTNLHICEMLEEALGREPYTNEPDRRQYLEEQLVGYRNKGVASKKKAARRAIAAFLVSLHDLRTRADYDPLGTPNPFEDPLDFVAEAKRMREIAGSFAKHVGDFVAQECEKSKGVS